MKWKNPKPVKIYEAIGAVADGRVEVIGNTAKVFSSSRNKFYEINYNPESSEIMSNDNSSYWTGTLGYPAVAFLISIKVLSYSDQIGNILKGVAWKDINQKYNNNFEKALEFILSSKTDNERKELAELVSKVDKEIKSLKLSMLGPRILPPEGY